MLKATLREIMGQEEKSRQSFSLDRSSTPQTITLGRGDCDYRIGEALGKWGQGISGVQATIEIPPDPSEPVLLIDGTRARPSTNGIWNHNQPIDGSAVLSPGTELTLFKSGSAKVCLTISDTLSQRDPEQDTYTGEDLLSVLQGEVEEMKLQNDKMSVQVKALAGQLEQREAIDHHQTQTLDSLKKQVRRIVSGVLIFTAVIIVGFGLGKDLSSDERKEWRSLLGSIVKELLLAGVLGGSALYLNKEEKPTPSPTSAIVANKGHD